MHRTDVLVIGPLEPLFPGSLRVRLGVAVAGVAALVCAALIAALVVSLRIGLVPIPDALAGVFAGWTSVQDTTHVPPVQLASSPTGAEILLGTHELGATPLAVSVGPDDLLLLRRQGFLDAFVRVSGPNLDVPLWRSQPEVRLAFFSSLLAKPRTAFSRIFHHARPPAGCWAQATANSVVIVADPD